MLTSVSELLDPGKIPFSLSLAWWYRPLRTPKTALALILVMSPNVSRKGNHFGSQGESQKEMLLPELRATRGDSRRRRECEGSIQVGGKGK